MLTVAAAVSSINLRAKWDQPMKCQSLMLFTVAAGIALPLTGGEREAPRGIKRTMFLPAPLSDDWTRWIAGQWEGAGESDTGTGRATVRIELALNGQFLMYRGEGTITEITPEQKEYLKRHMHASDEEIKRFRSSPFRSLEIHTIDQETGEVVGHLFDSLRCMAKGRGKRQGNQETVEWEWATGHRSTRITRKVSDDKMVVIERTRMPGGSVMEEKGEMTRKK